MFAVPGRTVYTYYIQLNIIVKGELFYQEGESSIWLHREDHECSGHNKQAKGQCQTRNSRYAFDEFPDLGCVHMSSVHYGLYYI
jgi:hypothetical protein